MRKGLFGNSWVNPVENHGISTVTVAATLVTQPSLPHKGEGTFLSPRAKGEQVRSAPSPLRLAVDAAGGRAGNLVEKAIIAPRLQDSKTPRRKGRRELNLIGLVVAGSFMRARIVSTPHSLGGDAGLGKWAWFSCFYSLDWMKVSGGVEFE